MGNEIAGSKSRLVFVVHGRNMAARNAMFAFLRSLDLKPMEWEDAVSRTGSGSPYIGDVLDKAFEDAQAIVVLLTPDEVVALHPDYASGDPSEITLALQARPNVLFEAGLAFGRNSKRTILVEFGKMRPFSDVAGHHTIRLDNTPAARSALKNRLRTAGCEVGDSGDRWLEDGDFTPPTPALDGVSLLKTSGPPQFRADYIRRGSSSGTLKVTNLNSFDVYKVKIHLPEDVHQLIVMQDGVKERVPTNQTFSYITAETMADGPDQFELTIVGQMETGEPFEANAYVDLLA